MNPTILHNLQRLIVVGDLHGGAHSFDVVETMFNPNRDFLLFLGDYADRGPDGVHVIEGVSALLTHYPEQVVALMGNHEHYSERGRPNFSPCSLIDEVRFKLGSW